MIVIAALHWLAGLVVLAEALNKLERTCPLAAGLKRRERVTAWLKALAWMLLALGSAIACAAPVLLAIGVFSGEPLLMRLDSPTIAETCIMFGLAVLIVRTRMKEG